VRKKGARGDEKDESAEVCKNELDRRPQKKLENSGQKGDFSRRRERQKKVCFELLVTTLWGATAAWNRGPISRRTEVNRRFKEGGGGWRTGEVKRKRIRWVFAGSQAKQLKRGLQQTSGRLGGERESLAERKWRLSAEEGGHPRGKRRGG